MQWYLKVMQQYAVFSGRAQRAEYWFFILFYMLGYIILVVVDLLLGAYNAESGFGLLSGIFLLVHLLPSIAVSVRRLHDIGMTGWWYLLVIIPIIGPLVLLIFFVTDSKDNNEYGPNPKA